MHPPATDKEEFNAKISEICGLHAEAETLARQGVHLVSVDEKTGIQALEREVTPMKPGQAERPDHSYERHGTQCLIANLEIGTGKIIAPTVSDTRTEQDFLNHIKNTIAQHPDDKWIFIMDQLNTHKSESLVKFIAEYCNITQDLGEKGKSGILKNMESRATFLTDPDHKIRIVYTPKHASWLNQIECWFSILVRRLLKRLVTKSVEELKQKILDFIQYYNKFLAKIFKWNFKGFSPET